MKLRIVSDNLAAAVAVAIRGTDKRTTLPVLEGILLRASDAQVELYATDLEKGIHLGVSAKVEEEGAIVVPGKAFAQIAKGAPKGTLVVIETEGSKVAITVGSVTRRLQGIDADEFPTIIYPDHPYGIQLRAAELLAGIRAVIRFAASGDSRPVLSTVFFNWVGGRLALVAADNYALGEAVLDAEQTGKPDAPSFLVRHSAMVEVERLLAKRRSSPSDTVLISYGGSTSQAVFTFADGTRLTAGLMDAIFPNYQQVIPSKPSGTQVMFKASDMRELLAAMNGLDTVALTIADGTIRARGGENTESEFDGSIPADVTDKADISYLVWGVDPALLRSVIDSTDAESLTLSTTGPLTPALVLEVGNTDRRWAVMPKRLTGAA